MLVRVCPDLLQEAYKWQSGFSGPPIFENEVDVILYEMKLNSNRAPDASCQTTAGFLKSQLRTKSVVVALKCNCNLNPGHARGGLSCLASSLLTSILMKFIVQLFPAESKNHIYRLQATSIPFFICRLLHKALKLVELFYLSPFF